ncbi:MAG TPA: hypothetical protein VMW93_00290 [bacterium]|nr:hypothetical protein [bacterium]
MKGKDVFTFVGVAAAACSPVAGGFCGGIAKRPIPPGTPDPYRP